MTAFVVDGVVTGSGEGEWWCWRDRWFLESPADPEAAVGEEVVVDLEA